MKSEETALEVRPSDLLSVITSLVSNPDLDVEKMERLLAMHERVSAEQKKTAFMAALSRLQEKLPQINKEGRIIVSGQERSRYARLEDLDLAIKPLLAEEGFSFSFNEESAEGANRRYSARLSHREGHSELKYITLPLDTSGSKNGVQSAGSTASYASRYLIKMHLNIVERGADTDGHESDVITGDQVKDIRTMLQDAGANEATFLEKIAYVDKVEDIPAKDWKRVTNALSVKIEARIRAEQK